jgi:hypothetical protein
MGAHRTALARRVRKDDVMPQTAENFLASWTAAYVSADPRDRDTFDLTVALCFNDAARLGITREALTALAGGDLGTHLRKSLA